MCKFYIDDICQLLLLVNCEFPFFLSTANFARITHFCESFVIKVWSIDLDHHGKIWTKRNDVLIIVSTGVSTDEYLQE